MPPPSGTPALGSPADSSTTRACGDASRRISGQDDGFAFQCHLQSRHGRREDTGRTPAATRPGPSQGPEAGEPPAAIGEERAVAGFKQAFGDVERASDSALESAAGLTKLVKVMQKAAREGNIARLKRTRSELDAALDALRQAVAYLLPYLNPRAVLDELPEAGAKRSTSLDTPAPDPVIDPHIAEVLPVLADEYETLTPAAGSRG